MIKSRQEIKAIAKAAMKQQRGTSIVALLLAVLIGGVLGAISGVISIAQPLFGALVMFGVIFFIAVPLSVNLNGIFIKIYNKENASANELFSNFSVNYLRKVGGMAWMALFTYLWTLLLVIPGIIKGYAYSMTPFILADCPNVPAKEALKLSMRMTNGHKMKLFIFDLSFIGWLLLGTLTLHILTFAFVLPYYQTAYTGYYVELRETAIANGIIDRAELEGRKQ